MKLKSFSKEKIPPFFGQSIILQNGKIFYWFYIHNKQIYKEFMKLDIKILNEPI